jgi:hypothetical protein
MNYPKKMTDLVLGLVSEDDIRTFLLDCVNLPWSVTYPPHRPQFNRWFRRWQRLFTFQSEDENGNRQATLISREHLELLAPVVRTTLCRLWAEHDVRQRDWYFYRLRDAHRQLIRHLEGWEENSTWGGADTPKRLTDYVLQEVPTLCPFEAAIYWLHLNQRLMVRCEGPLCAKPYFFRSEKGHQKFCSQKCANPSRRESKLRWWNENRRKKTAKKTLR